MRAFVFSHFLFFPKCPSDEARLQAGPFLPDHPIFLIGFYLEIELINVDWEWVVAHYRISKKYCRAPYLRGIAGQSGMPFLG